MSERVKVAGAEGKSKRASEWTICCAISATLAWGRGLPDINVKLTGGGSGWFGDVLGGRERSAGLNLFLSLYLFLPKASFGFSLGVASRCLHSADQRRRGVAWCMQWSVVCSLYNWHARQGG